jgi:hypothetical protein
MNVAAPLIGAGIYTPADVARLAEVSAARVRGWITGYRRAATGKRGRPIIRDDLPPIDGKLALSFSELIEVRFIRHFLRAGVSWPAIRRAADEAHRELLDHQGARLRFSTDGLTVFADQLASGGDRRSRDLVANQYVLLLILQDSIKQEFDLEAGDLIRAWHPRPETPGVLLDPARSFGRPIVEPGIPTQALATALEAEGGDAALVAALFGTTEALVRQAAAFEMNLAA